MTNKAANHFSPQLAGWTPTPAAQLVAFWRIMHMFMARYGSIPLGQMLVDLTTVVLNELGRPPTVTDLCEATGLPKSSISRYVSAQMSQDLITEIIDPEDRRRRKLVLAEKGQAERQWQIKEIRGILEEVKSSDAKRISGQADLDPDLEFERMKHSNANAPENIGRKRKKRRAAAA
jgi:DNA-binding MarR family transcriptional regulator